MKISQPVICTSENKIVDEVLLRLGKTLVVGTPLAAGKANHLLNAFYSRAKANSTISLTIVSALTLERPKGKSLLEKRFLGPLLLSIGSDSIDLVFNDKSVSDPFQTVRLLSQNITLSRIDLIRPETPV